MKYEVRRRELLQRRPKLLDRLRGLPAAANPRQWELLRDGLPIGFYETRDAAVAASPGPPEILD